MKVRFLGLAAMAALIMSFTSAIDSLKVDIKESSVIWKGHKVTGTHTGTIQIKEGDLKFDNSILVGGSFDIDMSTIKNTDMKGEYSDKLMGHLKSEDFFSVTSHPVANFKITKSSKKSNAGDYDVEGNLTIKGITHPLSFVTNITENSNGYLAKADMKVDRTLYKIKYGSGKFFKGLGDKMIYDNFDLSVTLSVEK